MSHFLQSHLLFVQKLLALTLNDNVQNSLMVHEYIVLLLFRSYQHELYLELYLNCPIDCYERACI